MRELVQRKKLLLGIVLVMTVCCLVKMDVLAGTNLLTHTEISFFVGDAVSLRNYIDEEFLDENYKNNYNEENPTYTLSYQWNEQNTGSAASLNEQGMVSAEQSGTLLVDVTFRCGTVTHTEILKINVLEPEELAMSYGDSVALLASTVYDSSRYSYEVEGNSVIVGTDGKATAQGFSDAVVCAVNQAGTRVKVANVSMKKPVFAKENVARAVGSEVFTPKLDNYTAFEDDAKAKWSVSDNRYANATEAGIVAVKKGKTTVSVLLTARNGETIALTTNLYLTVPSLTEKEIVMASGIEHKMTVKGTCEYSEANWISTGGNAYFVRPGVVFGERKGNRKVKVDVDGLILTCQIIVTDPVYNKVSVVAYRGKTSTIKLSGLNKTKSVVSFASGNSATATVTKKGVVKAKKVGHVKIHVVADGRKFAIPVEIATRKAYRAAKTAISISMKKTQYSQARRMSKGYYDCSSLVWRVYKNYGYNFGCRGSWAPVAADIGKWCVTHKKVIAKKGVPYTKLLPGDLIFYSYTKNGRYKDISHVEMYTGQGMDVSASSSNNRVINYAYYNSSYIVLIARPTKK